MSLPQLPHSSRTEETQDSFSRPGSPVSTARAWLTGYSSQKTHRRQFGGRSARLSRVMLASRRDNGSPEVGSAGCLQVAGPRRRGGGGSSVLLLGYVSRAERCLRACAAWWA